METDTIESTTDVQGPTKVHGYFGLTYANYLVWHRSLMQSMPEEWQARFVALANEYDAAFEYVEKAPSYEVTAGTETEYDELDDDQLHALGLVRDEIPGYDDEDMRTVYVDRNGDAHEPHHTVLVPLPDGDPVPHYNRGRTYIAPKL